VGPLARFERADVVPPQHCGAATGGEPESFARGHRGAAAAAPGDEQGLLDLVEEVAALVRRGAVGAEADPNARVEQLPHGRDARAEPEVGRRAVRDADTVRAEALDL